MKLSALEDTELLAVIDRHLVIGGRAKNRWPEQGRMLTKKLANISYVAEDQCQ
jgi:hypothetical protein